MSESTESAPAPPSCPDRTELLADQRRRWQRGERVPVESYVERHPSLRGTPEALLDLIRQAQALASSSGPEEGSE